MGNTNLFKRFFATNLIILLFAGLMTACGGGDDDGDDPTNPGNPTTPLITRTLTGTAAVGAPIAGRITIIDANGVSFTTDSDATGVYSVNLGEHPGPYLIRIVPNDSNMATQYSYATSSGVTNITQFTSLALLLAYQINLADAFNNWVTTLSTWNRATLEQALATINANFAGALNTAGVDPLVYDFFKVPFAADQMGIDAFLDTYTVAINGTTYTITDNSDQQPEPFVENIDTSGYFIGALFIPDGAAAWTLTLSSSVDGVGSTGNPVTYPTNSIPWNEERFNEIFLDSYPDTSTQVSVCPDEPLISCNITAQISQFDTNYTVVGDGAPGTTVTGSFTFGYSVTGWYAVTGIPGSRVDIDETTTWSWTWTWERIS